mmetsp:Transcript_48097/g.114305  ORF Transcript_48097/g.114305 Transcript_48097/m.114305 type:complete len:548 (-) Transcript_48097:86-1729(-)
MDTYTSGFDGPWTNNPTSWDNQYFQLLVDQTWERHIGPGGLHQWRIPNAQGMLSGLMMLTSDLALLEDSALRAAVEDFAANPANLDVAFAEAWEKLSRSGDVWLSASSRRCVSGANFPEEPTMRNDDMCIGMAEGSPTDAVTVPTAAEYATLLEQLDIAKMQEIIADVIALLTDSKDCWPADAGNYGPFFIRMAWHCAGTFRESDGRGGCAGARQRFEPERSWPDNANLDKARALLWPVKEKHGDVLSWGDLIMLAGTAAIHAMEGPVSEFCFGRIDEADGSNSNIFGPNTAEADAIAATNCTVDGNIVNGRCTEPFGSTTMGLIYLNPEGPLEQGQDGVWRPNPDPQASVVDVKDAFSRMGMNASQTVALIGGGHAFGKCHGPCAGPTCGSGKGMDTYTSGFDGPWTNNPTSWDNQYFQLLVDQTWERHIGPGGLHQWRIPNAQGMLSGLMMLTSDLALLEDSALRAAVEDFAANPANLDVAFAEAWEKLSRSGDIWSSNMKCLSGSDFSGVSTSPTSEDPIGAGYQTSPFSVLNTLVIACLLLLL